jgi:hypothetical protein
MAPCHGLLYLLQIVSDKLMKLLPKVPVDRYTNIAPSDSELVSIDHPSKVRTTIMSKYFVYYGYYYSILENDCIKT